jgi:hypothetical protein
MSTQPISAIVAAFGQTVRDKFASPVVVGAPEDQLRGPLEVLVRDGLAVVAGIAQPVTLIGETSLADIQTRPDYAVAVGKTLVGFIEVKAPGKGAESQKITVVIGNPPDKEKAEGQGGWVEAAAGGGTTAVMERWRRRRRGASAHMPST